MATPHSPLADNDSPWKEALDHFLRPFLAFFFPAIHADLAAELETSASPFAPIVLAHLQAQATRRDPGLRHQWKLRLVQGLYDRGWHAEDVRQLFRLIDWLMELPVELQRRFRTEMYDF